MRSSAWKSAGSRSIPYPLSTCVVPTASFCPFTVAAARHRHRRRSFAVATAPDPPLLQIQCIGGASRLAAASGGAHKRAAATASEHACGTARRQSATPAARACARRRAQAGNRRSVFSMHAAACAGGRAAAAVWCADGGWAWRRTGEAPTQARSSAYRRTAASAHWQRPWQAD